MIVRKNRLSWVFICLVVFLAIVVRFVKLDKVPAALYYDEIDLGYQVKSLLTTGRDYRNVLSPFYFRSFNTDKTPLPIYFSVLPSLLFTSPEYQVRAGAALAGVVCVVLAMFLAFQLTGKRRAGIITGLVFAFSPWQIQFSRMAFEAIFMLMVFLASISVFLYWQRSRKGWAFYLSAVLLGLNVYTYRTMSLFAPLTVILLLVIFFKDIWREGLVRVGVWLIIICGIILPFLYATTIGSADQTRIDQISVFSDPTIPIKIVRSREVDSNDFGNPQIGKSAVWWSPIFHNKVLSYVTNFGVNYYKNFSADFLFLSGDPNGRHTPSNTGELLFIDVVGLAIGLVVVVKKIRDKKYQLLLGLLFLSPIPSDLTIDGAYHASRLMILAGPLLLVVGLGYMELISWFAKNKKYWVGVPIFVTIWIVAVVFYLQQYFVHFPIESARQFGYGYKQAVLEIVRVKNRYQSVRLTSLNDPPMLYFLYWSNTPPKDVQSYGTNFDEAVIKQLPLDSIKPISWGAKICTIDEIIKLDPKTLYLAAFNNLPMDFRSADKNKVPAGIKLVDVIKYPDNEVAYYLITRDTKNGMVVMPDKSSACR
ncbi:phospholipid carrier-dependent glycosyltransferase [bacterium]|nr:MAG: phospholipid carrier-dependent glycosyltransferase [bacterium]